MLIVVSVVEVVVAMDAVSWFDVRHVESLGFAMVYALSSRSEERRVGKEC